MGPPHHRALDPLYCQILIVTRPRALTARPGLFSDGTSKTACPPSWGGWVLCTPQIALVERHFRLSLVFVNIFGNGRKLSVLFPEKHTDTKR